MREDIIFAGFGGQGIMFMGKMLSYTAMNEGLFVTWMPSYGAEVRGGTAHSMIIIDDSAIASPVVKEPSVCVVMNKPSFDKFEAKVKEKGLLVINSSLVKDSSRRKDIEILQVPATDIAFKLGNQRIANMVMLGALVAARKIVTPESLIRSLIELIPENRKALLSINQEAIKQGYEYSSR
ncbi:MAG TPA: 2-oxoacid:ferredoxin oxidoreductase subunit gamma [Candidatus Omnitrophica bacterium]|nr:2-oxoacid:ferredoxin oxidoreductase subunit gamma [Candidatus Omnitrophota bacterium]